MKTFRIIEIFSYFEPLSFCNTSFGMENTDWWVEIENEYICKVPARIVQLNTMFTYTIHDFYENK